MTVELSNWNRGCMKYPHCCPVHDNLHWCTYNSNSILSVAHITIVVALFSGSVMSNSNSCPLSRWYHPTVSSSVVPFASCLQFFPASGSFPMSRLFSSGGQSIGASALTSVLPMNIQDWFPLGFTKTFIFITRAYLSCQNKKSRLLCFFWTYYLESESVSRSVMSYSLQPIDHNLPGSSVHGILQARIWEWVAFLFSRGSSPPRDYVWVSLIVSRFFTVWATREAHLILLK